MRLIAHRGFAGVHPENTVPALRSAARCADAVEVDVRRCGSGDIVVVHDETVDRVTDGAGRVAEMSADGLAGLNVLGSGAGIPTLDAVFEALPPETDVNVELKERGTAADALAVAREFDNEVWVSSFDATALEDARSADPGVDRAYLFDGSVRRSLATARDLDCAAVHPAWPLCLRSRVVGRAHRAGMAVNAWTLALGPAARALRGVGVDGVIADRPGVL